MRKDPIKFNTVADMLDYIRSGHDLYSPSEQTYVFEYNDMGSICVYYHISEEKAEELDATGDWWSSSLSLPDSHIFDSRTTKEEEPDLRHGPDDLNDDALEWCFWHFLADDWIDVSK